MSDFNKVCEIVVIYFGNDNKNLNGGKKVYTDLHEDMNFNYELNKYLIKEKN